LWIICSAKICRGSAGAREPHPFFVSDAMWRMCGGLQRWRRRADRRESFPSDCAHSFPERPTTREHWHYGTSLFFFQLPEDLLTMMAGADLVVVKGDANYRRLLVTRTGTDDALRASHAILPTRLVALRTLKAEIVVGLKPGKWSGCARRILLGS